VQSSAAGKTRLIDSDPFLVAAVAGEWGRVSGPAVGGPEDRGRKVPAETAVVDGAVGTRAQAGVGVEDAALQDARVRPCAPAVAAVRAPGLAEVAGDGVELPPADGDAVGRGGVDGNAGLVGGIAEDVHAAGADVDLSLEVVARVELRRRGLAKGVHGRDIG